MVYVFAATYYEASAWISYYHLKKDTAVSRFQMFCGEEGRIRLVVTESGGIRAAVAVSSICTAFAPGTGDFLLNVGICAAVSAEQKRVGELFLCHKITETVTGKTFYPDLLYRHGFGEAELVTGPCAYREGVCQREGFFLYDMEASAVYQAGSYFFAPHRMVFLKIVSDYGDADAVTPERVKELCSLHMEALADFAGRLCAIGRREEKPALGDAAEEERLCRMLCCSVSMEASVKQLIRYCRLAGVEFDAAIRELYREGMLPCRTKKEGKRCLEELGKRLL